MKVKVMLILVLLFVAGGPTMAQSRHLWGDFDADGLSDFLMLSSKGNKLMRNLGNGGFEDVTGLAFPGGAGRGVSGFWGDFNRDGLLDLFIMHEEGCALYRNQGKRYFLEVTEETGLPASEKFMNARFEDYDRDGYLDLLVITSSGDRIFRNHDGYEFVEVVLFPDLIEPEADLQAEDSTLILNSAESNSAVKNEGAGELPEDREWIVPSGRGARNPSFKGSGHAFRGNVDPANPIPGPDSPSSSENLSSQTLTADGKYLNDNSPGSVGEGVPEVEGGDDGSTQNDIVDNTVTGADIQDASLTGNDIQNNSLSPAKVNGTAATLTGNQSFDYGTLFLDAANNCVGVGTLSPYAKLDVMGNGDYGIYGLTNKASGNAYGVYGTVVSPEGHGVHGSGGKEGVFGESYSTIGAGVLGWASSSSGNTHGVYGQAESPEGEGVVGYATSLSGDTYGVRGMSYSEDGVGVLGYVPFDTTAAETTGVWGMSMSQSGRGVYGLASGTTGYNRGVIGETLSDQGYGVMGLASSTTGTASGVYGSSASPDGHGVTGFGETSGVYGLTYSIEGGAGVRGEAHSASGWNYGVYGTNHANIGSGVYGENYGFDGTGVYGVASYVYGTGYGVWGLTYSSSGYGMYCSGDFGASGNKYFVQPHPSDASKEIRYVCLEGNESGTYFRGSAELNEGSAIIEVPEDFRLVSEEKGLTVQVTPTGPALVWVEETNLERIVVRGDMDVSFHYFVNGVRRGFADHEPMRENVDWVPRYRGVPYGTQYPQAVRDILVENGTLNPDFTPNEATANKLGWTLIDLSDEADPSERVSMMKERTNTDSDKALKHLQRLEKQNDARIIKKDNKANVNQ